MTFVAFCGALAGADPTKANEGNEGGPTAAGFRVRGRLAETLGRRQRGVEELNAALFNRSAVQPSTDLAASRFALRSPPSVPPSRDHLLKAANCDLLDPVKWFAKPKRPEWLSQSHYALLFLSRCQFLEGVGSYHCTLWVAGSGRVSGQGTSGFRGQGSGRRTALL